MKMKKTPNPQGKKGVQFIKAQEEHETTLSEHLLCCKLVLQLCVDLLVFRTRIHVGVPLA
jgi:hypothetical protein